MSRARLNMSRARQSLIFRALFLLVTSGCPEHSCVQGTLICPEHHPAFVTRSAPGGRRCAGVGCHEPGGSGARWQSERPGAVSHGEPSSVRSRRAPSGCGHLERAAVHALHERRVHDRVADARRTREQPHPGVGGGGGADALRHTGCSRGRRRARTPRAYRSRGTAPWRPPRARCCARGRGSARVGLVVEVRGA